MIYTEKEAAQMRAAWWALDLVGSDTKLTVLADALYIEKAKYTAISAGELPDADKVIYPQPEANESRPKLREECNQKVAQFLIDHDLMWEYLHDSSGFILMLSREQLEGLLLEALIRLRVPTAKAPEEPLPDTKAALRMLGDMTEEEYMREKYGVVSLQDFHADLYYIEDRLGERVEVDEDTYHAIPDAHVLRRGASESGGELATTLSTHTCQRTKILQQEAFDEVIAGLDQPLKREYVLIRIEGEKP